jgi:hypothetical protein
VGVSLAVVDVDSQAKKREKARARARERGREREREAGRPGSDVGLAVVDVASKSLPFWQVEVRSYLTVGQVGSAFLPDRWMVERHRVMSRLLAPNAPPNLESISHR